MNSKSKLIWPLVVYFITWFIMFFAPKDSMLIKLSVISLLLMTVTGVLYAIYSTFTNKSFRTHLFAFTKAWISILIIIAILYEALNFYNFKIKYNDNHLISYNNKAFGYSVEYPDTWKVLAPNNIGVSSFSEPIISSPCTKNSSSCASIMIESAKCDVDIICQEVSSKYKYKSLSSYMFSGITDIQEIQIGKNKALTFTYSGKPILKMGDETPIYNETVTLLKNKDLTYEIVQREWGKNIKTTNDWQYKGTLEKIINSFEFTN